MTVSDINPTNKAPDYLGKFHISLISKRSKSPDFSLQYSLRSKSTLVTRRERERDGGGGGEGKLSHTDLDLTLHFHLDLKQIT